MDYIEHCSNERTKENTQHLIKCELKKYQQLKQPNKHHKNYFWKLYNDQKA